MQQGFWVGDEGLHLPEESLFRPGHVVLTLAAASVAIGFEPEIFQGWMQGHCKGMCVCGSAKHNAQIWDDAKAGRRVLSVWHGPEVDIGEALVFLTNTGRTITLITSFYENAFALMDLMEGGENHGNIVRGPEASELGNA